LSAFELESQNLCKKILLKDMERLSAIKNIIETIVFEYEASQQMSKQSVRTQVSFTNQTFDSVSLGFLILNYPGQFIGPKIGSCTRLASLRDHHDQ
jgi:hypothetical protein